MFLENSSIRKFRKYEKIFVLYYVSLNDIKNIPYITLGRNYVFYKLHELENNLKLRNKLLKLGLGCPIVDPTGPKGDIKRIKHHHQYLQVNLIVFPC